MFNLFWLLYFIFWLWMLIDCLTSAMPGTEKLIWTLVIIFIPLIGSILYCVIQRPNARAR